MSSELCCSRGGLGADFSTELGISAPGERKIRALAVLGVLSYRMAELYSNFYEEGAPKIIRKKKKKKAQLWKNKSKYTELRPAL